jgi:hypothetical protein
MARPEVAEDTHASRPQVRPNNSGAPPKGFCWIYFFGTEDGREIKVGRTRQRAAIRKRQHEWNNGRIEPLRTLAVGLGTPADEKALKRYFAHVLSRQSKEWIHAGADVRDYLRFLRDLPYVARDDSPEEMAAVSLVPSTEWLPNEGRRKLPIQMMLAEDDPWGDIYTADPGAGDFYTHPDFIAAARAAMGSIDLDPASCREANRVVQATTFYGERENGLLRPWRGAVWLNPPFGIWDEWTPKLLAELDSGRVEQLCALVSSRATTQKRFHPAVRRAAAIFIACGRKPFWGPKATSSPDEGHCVFYFGERVTEFANAFRSLGTTFLRDLRDEVA